MIPTPDETALGADEGKVDMMLEAAAETRHAKSIRPSEIGHPCQRLLWLQWRWMFSPERIGGQLVRIFSRGNREEAHILRHLKQSGYHVIDRDPDTGHQWKFSVLNGHMNGAIDAETSGWSFAPMEWGPVECKSHNDKSFSALLKHGISGSKPLHYAQCVLYAFARSAKWCVYAAVNKDTEKYKFWRIAANVEYAKHLLQKATLIRDSKTAPERIGSSPSHANCRTCKAASVCYGLQPTLKNCRSCVHAAPIDGGKWFCDKHHTELGAERIKTGCDDHTPINIMVN